MTAPASVAIVAMGGTCVQFVDAAKAAGGSGAIAQEVWAINAMGGVIRHDRLFAMDDVAVQELRAPGNPAIAAMLAWLRTHPGPVYTSAVRPGYPGLVAFPLEEAVNALGCGPHPYFNTTTAYALAYAILIGVPRVSLWGMDFTYANGAYAEDGRACLEYWIGFARARGMTVKVASRSTLLDTCKPLADRVYGYDGFDVGLTAGADRTAVALTARPLPTAAEIERRYGAKHRPAAQR